MTSIKPITPVIRPMAGAERQASKERELKNNWRKCVSCGNATKGTWCGFCLEEE